MVYHRLEPPISDDASLDVRGIFTESDFLRLVALPALDARSTPLRDVMTSVDRIAYATEDNDVSSCLQAMASLRCHHMPVLSREGDDLIGVLYIGELVGLTRKHLEESLSAWEVGRGVGRAIEQAAEKLRSAGPGNDSERASSAPAAAVDGPIADPAARSSGDGIPAGAVDS